MTLAPVLTIAGSDSSGGAGIQADIKTMLANNVYAMSAIAALTAQNTLGVRSILEVTPAFLADQLDAIFEDIPPLAVKIGMVASTDLIAVIADKLQAYQATNIVLDPVMVANSGAKLINDEAITSLKNRLFPLATVITPNILEAEILATMKIHTADDMIAAARKITDETAGDFAVLLKGGHRPDNADDLLYNKGEISWYRAERIDNPNTHGTGCTLSSAIAANLAQGKPLAVAVADAKTYLLGALNARLNLGQGNGPLHHGYNMSKD